VLGKFWDLKCCLKKLENIGSYEGLTELASTVLYARGFSDLEGARRFLKADRSSLYSPMLLSGMECAVKAIRRAIAEGKTILVYGDYDVDGITSTYLLTDYLASVGAKTLYRIPDRISNGYGMTCAMVDEIKAMGADMIITVDNGITACNEIAHAAELGMEVVVTDHHECPAGPLPDCLAVINPRKPEDPYPFKALAGVGVAFKLASALDGDQEKILDRYGDIVAIGTVADVMELRCENRILVKRGLEMLENTRNPGLSALMDASGARTKRLSAATVNFTLAPRINAAGRLSKADTALDLFREKNPQKAMDLAQTLCDLNYERQAGENELFAEVEEMLKERRFLPERDKAIVLWGKNWCGGITGIVCSRLMALYGVPVILMTVEDGIVKGSGRSLEGFNLYDALAALSDCLEKYGGHALAAGLTMKEEKLEEFRDRFLAYAEKAFEKTDIRPVLRIDSEIRARSLSVENIEGLSALEPYGNGWPQPVFAMFGVRLTEVTPVGMGKHLRLTLEKCCVTLTAMFFRVTPEEFDLKPGDQADVAFMLDISTFRGNKEMQLIVQDIRPCECVGRRGLELCRRFQGGEELCRCEMTSMRPQREDFVALWHYLCHHLSGKIMRLSVGELSLGLRKYENRDTTAAKIYVALEAFREVGLVDVEVDSDGRILIRSVRRTTGAQKINLEETDVMKRLC